MASERKIAANRENSKRSTGPRTRQGKIRSSWNAVKHGLLSRRTLLPNEDPKKLKALARTLRADLNPRGPCERVFADMMISDLWKRRRIARMEVGIIKVYDLGSLNLLSRYGIARERSFYRAFETLQGLQQARRGGRVPSSSAPGGTVRRGEGDEPEPIGAL